jgi:hypothetical protein
MASRVTPSAGRKSDKIWRDAIMRAVHRVQKGEKTKRLETLAEALVKKAIDGDVTALKEIGDRVDGKPTQGVTVGGDKDNPVHLSLEVNFVSPRKD